MYSVKCIRWACLFGAIVSLFTPSLAFAPAFGTRNVPALHKTIAPSNGIDVSPRSVQLYSSNDDEVSESNQGILGAIGCVASLTYLYSEFVLVNTGCGLPTAPFGLVGLVEGLSYLIVVGIVKFSVFTKKTTVCSSRMLVGSFINWRLMCISS